MKFRHPKLAGIGAMALLLITLAGCGGNGQGSFHGGGNGMLSVNVSGTNTCSAANGGPFAHVYVTVSDVQASTSATAPAGDASFVDVTPGLSSSPKLVDLLGTPNQCSLATLASNVSLASGTYQQFRVFFAPNSALGVGGPCGSFSNCVLLAGNATPQELQAGTEASQGILISANAMNKIAGGSFTPASNAAQTLGLAFNSCASVVKGSGPSFRLRPALTAGDATGAPAISGQLLDSVTQQTVPSGHFLVALEAPDTRGIDRVMVDTLADKDGNFNLCPVMGGPYDVVASGVRTDTTVAYEATVTVSVPTNTKMGTVPVVATAGSAASVLGAVDTSASVGTAASTDLVISALQVTGAGTVVATVPPVMGFGSTVVGDTEPSGTCPSGTDCAQFGLEVPAAAPLVGQFSASSTAYTQSGAVPSYQIEGTTFAPLSGATPFCSPNFQIVSVTSVTPGGVFDTTAQPLSFLGCQ